MKIRARDIVLALVSLLALVAGGMTLFSNIGAEDTAADQRVMMWYLSLHSVLFMVIAVLGVLESLFHDKMGVVKKMLYGGNVLIAGAYTLLVIVDASPLITEFIAKELWRSGLSILTLSIYLIYLAIGLLMIALCINPLRGHLENQRSLGWMLIVFALLSAIPSIIFSFQYNISDTLHTTTILYMLASTVLQALPVYAVFCSQGKGE